MTSLLIGLTISGVFTAQAASRPTVLITSFEPFQGPTNSSQGVAAELARLNGPGSAIEYVFCTLPTEYERSFKVARGCYEALKTPPAAVLSLGQSTDKLKVETLARNRDDDFMSDNAGVKRSGAVIEPGGPDELKLTLPIEEMLCATGQFGHADVARVVTPSITDQTYVCNDLAYRFARHLAPRHVPFGFMHVPDQKHFRYDESPAQVADRIDRMMRVAVARANPPPAPAPCAGGKLARATRGTLDSIQKGCLSAVRRRLNEQRKALAGEPSEESY